MHKREQTYVFLVLTCLWVIMVNTVFIVDDEPSIVQLFSIFVVGQGYEVAGVASNGKAAVDAYKALAKKPDLIIMDHRMPIKTGIEASIDILAINPRQKIVVATADVTIKEKAKQIGVVDVISKPFDMDDFFVRIKAILGSPELKPSKR